MLLVVLPSKTFLHDELKCIHLHICAHFLSLIVLDSTTRQKTNYSAPVSCLWSGTEQRFLFFTSLSPSTSSTFFFTSSSSLLLLLVIFLLSHLLLQLLLFLFLHLLLLSILCFLLFFLLLLSGVLHLFLQISLDPLFQ